MHRLHAACCLICCAALSVAVAIRADEEDPFAQWEDDIRAFEAADKEKPPEPGGVLFVGSSSIRLWDLKKSFPDLAALNRGFGGSRIADVAHFAERIVLNYKPRLIVFYSGDNDIAGGKTPQQVVADFDEFLDIVEKHLPETHVILLPIKPSVARWKLWPQMEQANAGMKKLLSRREQWHYAETTAPMLGDAGRPRPELFVVDGLHLNEEGYALWTKILQATLREIAAAKP